MQPKIYTKKPVDVEAMKLTRESIDSLCDWVATNGGHIFINNEMVMATIVTLEGSMFVTAGDYIIRGVNGEFYPCAPYIFDKTYNPKEG